MLFHTGNKKGFPVRSAILFVIFAALMLLCGSSSAKGADKIAQRTFPTPEKAALALSEAAKAHDSKQLLTILGGVGETLVFSGDTVADANRLDRFARAYEEKNQIVMENEKKAVLEVGKDGWPLPIPIVAAGNGEWRFDTRQGKEEILNRWIGANELSAIQVCLAYVDAQREYASKDREGDGLFEYAQKFLSDPGKENGLFWVPQEGGEESPLGPLIGKAKGEGYGKKPGNRPTPYHGYFYKILKAQGKNAPRGAMNYVIQGRMIGGFAMVAYPARYGTSGIMSFIVSQDGVVYEKNLGKNTASIARSMTEFNPDSTWRKVEGKDLASPGKEGGA